jgi:Phage integrase family
MRAPSLYWSILLSIAVQFLTTLSAQVTPLKSRSTDSSHKPSASIATSLPRFEDVAHLGVGRDVRWIVEQYRAEKLPKLRHSTQRVAGLWLNKYALGHWGDRLITDLQPRPVELWLDSLPLAPKTRGHLRELLHRLVDYAMWSGAIPVGTNPRRRSEFRGADDWMFPSPLKFGRLPYSYMGYWRALQDASSASGLGRLGTHSFRHTYRSWLDAVGTALTVQQRLMRHSDIQTTLNIYGDVVTGEMQEASSKVASLALET